MKKNFLIRQFEETDLEEIIHINQTCLPENYSSSFFLDIYQKFPKTFLIATADKKVVGYLMFRIEIGFSNSKRFKISRKGHLISLAIQAEYRGRGIASNLLSEALRKISEYDISECYLEVRVSNKTAIDLYKRLKFKITRTLHGYYQNGEDAYLMSMNSI